jgi:hypothetical protein
MSNALAVYSKIDSPIAFAQEFAESAAAMCGCDIRQGKAMAMLALTEGIDLMQLRRRYHWIEGKPTMQAAAMLAEFRMNHGGSYKVTQRDEKATRITFTDKYGETYDCEMTLEQAMSSRWPWKKWKNKDEGLKDNWATPLDQKTMMFARCVSDSLRFICPELVAGVYTPEEIVDLRDDGGPVATNGSAAPKASEIIASHATANGSSQAVDAVAAADGNDDAIDAEFVPAATAATSTDPAAPGSATKSQLDEINDLMGKLWDGDKLVAARAAALEKRGVQSFHNLSKVQADELLGKLRDKARVEASAKN